MENRFRFYSYKTIYRGQYKNNAKTQGDRRIGQSVLFGDIENSPRIDEQKEKNVAQKANDCKRGTYDKGSFGSARNEGESFRRLHGRVGRATAGPPLAAAVSWLCHPTLPRLSRRRI